MKDILLLRSFNITKKIQDIVTIIKIWNNKTLLKREKGIHSSVSIL